MNTVIRAAAGILRALVAVALSLGASYIAGHPSHSSYAEVEWSDQGSLDVSLKLIPEDLERALTSEARRRIVLVDEPEVRAVLADYLSRHFRLIGGEGRNPKEPSLELVGMELDYRDTWIYFSLQTPDDSVNEAELAAVPSSPSSGQGAGLWTSLRNTILMDVEPGQTNRVRRLWAPDAPVLVFSATEPERDLTVVEGD